MAQTTNPFGYKSDRVPLVGNQTNRLASAAKDQVFYNVLPESIKNEITDTKKVWLSKRGSFTADTTVIGGGGVARALFYWNLNGKKYSIIGDKLYSNSSAIQTLATSTGTAWITEFLGSAGSVLFVCDGIDAYTVSTTDVVVSIVDVDLPTTMATPVFFDSYIFVAKPNTPFIFNSDVDDPMSWDPTNFLSAEQYADHVVALTRQMNYVVAFGPYSTEFFFDQENASGSPLSRQESVSIKVGLAARDTVMQVDRRILFVAQTQTGDPSVWLIDGLTGTEISNEFIRKILANEGSALATARAFIISHKGHILYVLNLTGRTIVFDCNEKIWVDWSTNSASTHAVLPFGFATEGANNTVLVLHNTDGKIYKLDPAVHQDDAGAVLVEIITDRVDFSTDAFKHQARISLVGDIQASGTVTIDWTDDDYQTYSTARTLDLTLSRAFTKAGGMFRRRAYRVRYSGNTPFRAEALEIDYALRVT